MIQLCFPSMQDHPKLGAPIADVIIRDHAMAHKFGQPR